MRKRHSQKFQYASDGISVGSDNIFIKENERLDVAFTKIICPARFASHDQVIQVINYVEIKARCGPHLELLARLLDPNTCLLCYGPRDRLLDAVPAAQPNIFRPVENRGEELRRIEIPVCGNFLQHLNHTVEVRPHYCQSKDSIRASVFLKDALETRGVRPTSPALFPCLVVLRSDPLRKEIFTRRPGACTSEDAAKQVCAAAWNGTNDV
jgi:hypothetical protein